MAQVPSNLIPTRITELPSAPVASPDGLLVYVYEGNTYQITAGQLLNTSGVPTSRQVIAGTGLTGGGALSSNVTLSIAAGGVGTTQLTTSGVTAGVYGDATNVPQVTVDATGRVTAATSVPVAVSGYVPTSRQVIAGTGLAGGGALTGNVTLTASLSSATPESVSTTGSAGISTSMSRADHKHPAIDLAADAQVDGLLGLGNGGTARSIVASAGSIIYSGADGLYTTSVGASGQVLVSAGSGTPAWGSAVIVSDQPANVVYAGPTSGAAAPTSFRTLVNADLPTSGAVAATYGSATQVAVVTVNSKGVATSVSNATITPAFADITSKPTTLSGYGITDGQPLDATLTSIAGLTSAANKLPYFTGVDTATVTDFSAYARTLVDDADATTARTTLGLGSAAILTAGSANGVATLDAGGTVPLSQIPASIQGGVSYQGTWNATTNSPTLTSGSGTKGYYYVVSVAGSTNLDGITTWVVGDWVIFNGTAWQKVDNTDAVTSVNGYTGTVSLAYADIAGAVPTWNQNTTGTAAGLSTTLAIGSGGTGQVTANSAFNALAPAQGASSGKFLTTDGTNTSWGVVSIGDGTLTMAVSGVGLSGSQTFTANQSSAAAFTVTSNATSANTASTIVARDASGNFTAGTITAALVGNASTATNGVVTTGSYADPSWITSLTGSKITGQLSNGISGGTF